MMTMTTSTVCIIITIHGNDDSDDNDEMTTSTVCIIITIHSNDDSDDNDDDDDIYCRHYHHNSQQ